MLNADGFEIVSPAGSSEKQLNADGFEIVAPAKTPLSTKVGMPADGTLNKIAAAAKAVLGFGSPIGITGLPDEINKEVIKGAIEAVPFSDRAIKFKPPAGAGAIAARTGGGVVSNIGQLLGIGLLTEGTGLPAAIASKSPLIAAGVRTLIPMATKSAADEAASPDPSIEKFMKKRLPVDVAFSVANMASGGVAGAFKNNPEILRGTINALIKLEPMLSKVGVKITPKIAAAAYQVATEGASRILAGGVGGASFAGATKLMGDDPTLVDTLTATVFGMIHGSTVPYSVKDTPIPTRGGKPLPQPPVEPAAGAPGAIQAPPKALLGQTAGAAAVAPKVGDIVTNRWNPEYKVKVTKVSKAGIVEIEDQAEGSLSKLRMKNFQENFIQPAAGAAVVPAPVSPRKNADGFEIVAPAESSQTKKLKEAEVYEIVKKAYAPYALRGDTEAETNQGQFGRSLGEINGSLMTQKHKANVELADGRKFSFSLPQVWKDILATKEQPAPAAGKMTDIDTAIKRGGKALITNGDYVIVGEKLKSGKPIYGWYRNGKFVGQGSDRTKAIKEIGKLSMKGQQTEQRISSEKAQAEYDGLMEKAKPLLDDDLEIIGSDALDYSDALDAYVEAVKAGKSTANILKDTNLWFDGHPGYINHTKTDVPAQEAKLQAENKAKFEKLDKKYGTSRISTTIKTKEKPLERYTNVEDKFRDEMMSTSIKKKRPGETDQQSYDRTKAWISGELSNDETSTPEELADYFVKEGGFSPEVAKFIADGRDRWQSEEFKRIEDMVAEAKGTGRIPKDIKKLVDNKRIFSVRPDTGQVKKAGSNEFKVGDVLDPQGNTNMVGQVRIKEINGNTLKFVDSKGTEYQGMARSQIRKLIEGNSWKRVSQPTGEQLTPYDTPEILAARAKADAIPQTINDDSPERLAMRDKWANDYDRKFEAKTKDRRIDLIIGPTAAGKSTLSQKLLQEHGAIEVDSDIPKKDLLPADVWENGIGAKATHLEASNIMFRVAKKAIRRGDNIIFTTTGRNTKRAERIIEKISAKYGYTVHVHYIDVPEAVAMKSAFDRFTSGKDRRFVDPKEIMGQELKIRALYANIKHKKGVDSYARYERSEGGLKTVESGRNGERLPGQLRESSGRSGQAGQPAGGQQLRTKLSGLTPQDKGRPEYGKQYALTGKTGTPAIFNGNTWSESEVEPTDVMNPYTRVKKLVDKFTELADKGAIPKGPVELRKVIAGAIGGDPAKYYDEMYDAMEMGINRVAHESLSVKDRPFRDRMKVASLIEATLPTRNRSTKTIDKQQFSTPLTLATAANELLDAKPGMVILEPTAGTGNLIIPFAQKGQGIIANEFDELRATILKQSGNNDVYVTKGDFLAYDGTKPDAIIANPPFGSLHTGKYAKFPTDFNATNIDQRFIAKMLRILPLGGRIVVITSTGTGYGDSGIRFRKWLQQNHTFIASIASPDGAYSKRGTDTNTSLLLIEKGQNRGIIEPLIKSEVSGWQEYNGIIEDLKNRFPNLGASSEGQISNNKEGGPINARANEVRVPAVKGPSGQPSGRSRKAVMAGNKPGGSGITTDQSGQRPPVLSGQQRGPGEPGTDIKVQGDVERRAPVVGPGEGESQAAKGPTPRRVGHFIEYKRNNTLPINSPHPSTVIESEELSAVDYPKITYNPGNTILKAYKNGDLSNPQVDAAMLALQTMILDDGVLNADGTGLGKTRIMAAVAGELLESGKAKRVLYVTLNKEVLQRHLEDDFSAVMTGGKGNPLPYPVVRLEGIPNLDKAQVPVENKALYTITKDLLRDNYRAIENLGIDALIVDEAHKWRADQGDTPTAIAWESIHKYIGKRPTMYATASPGSDLKELAYLKNLDLGAAAKETQNATKKNRFVSHSAFSAGTSIPMAQQVMREGKMRGKFMARDIDLSGVTYNLHKVEMTPDDIAEYDRYIAFLKKVHDAGLKFGKFNKSKGGGNIGQIKSQFQFAVKRRQTDLKVIKTIDLILDTIKTPGKGDRVFIFTNALNKLKENAPLGHVRAMINKINEESIQKVNGVLTDPEIMPEAIEVKNLLMEEMADYPQPLDIPAYIKQQLSKKMSVADYTGKTSTANKKKNLKDWMDGKVDVMLGSAAAKTAISAHDLVGRPITVLYLDIDWTAEDALQALGRVARTGQKTDPKMLFVNMGAAGEQKFMATIATRFKALGAVSKGQAESGATDFLGKYDLEGSIAHEAARRSYTNLDRSDKEYFINKKLWERDPIGEGDMRPRRVAPEEYYVDNYMFDLLAMPFKKGNELLNHFRSTYDNIMANIKDSDRYKIRAEQSGGKELRRITLVDDPAKNDKVILHEVQDKTGKHFGILTGMLTDKFRILNDYSVHQFIKFTAGRETFSGYKVLPSFLSPLAQRFGKQVASAVTPENAFDIVMAGDKVLVSGDLELYKRKDGDIGITNAKMKDKTRLMGAGAGFNSVGSAWVIPEPTAEKLQRFLKEYPLRTGVLSEAPEAEGFGGNPLTNERGSVPIDVVTAGIPAFVEQDVIPNAKVLRDGIIATARSLRQMLLPTVGVNTQSFDKIMQMKGERDKNLFMFEQSTREIDKMFSRMPQEKQVDFINRVKRGDQQPTDELQAVADMMRDVDTRTWLEAKRYRPSLAWKDNHYRVIWKVIPGPEGSDVGTERGDRGIFGKRPLRGSMGFAKRATLVDISEGLGRGGVPMTYNPMEMFKLAYTDMMKFITANRMFDAQKKIGYVKFVRTGKPTPPGFIDVPDSISNVYFPAEVQFKEGGPTYKKPVKLGKWVWEENTGRIMNNFLSRDLIREQAVGRGLMYLKNSFTSAELSISPFHFVFETIESAGSDIGIGLRKLWNLGVIKGDLKEMALGAKEILGSQFAPVRVSQLGGDVYRYLTKKDFLQSKEGKSFIDKFPNAEQLIEDYFSGGGLPEMSADFKLNTIKAWRESVNNNNPIGAVIRTVPALNDLLMQPLFNVYIPRLKMGLFFKEFPLRVLEMERELATGKVTRSQLAREVINFIDHRFGELNFDNLFWNRTFKTSLQIFFRSVTWKFGNLAGFANVSRQAAEFADAIKEKRAPRIHPNMAWLLGLTAQTVLLSTIIMYAFTRQFPEKIVDVPYPRVDSEGDRISIPTYWKDPIHLVHSPFGYLTSSMSGFIGRTFDQWSNKDFYGNKIFQEDDPIQRQLYDRFLAYLPKPFSISSFVSFRDSGRPLALQAAGLFAFTRAPKYVTKSKAALIASEILGHKRQVGGRTREQAEKGEIKRQLSTAFRDKDYQRAREIIKSRKLSRDEVWDIRRSARKDPLQNQIKSFNVDESLKVWEAASNEERRLLYRPMLTKIRNAIANASMEERPVLVELRRKFAKERPF